MFPYFDWRLPLPGILQKRLVNYLVKKSLHEYLDCSFDLEQLDIQWDSRSQDDRPTRPYGYFQLTNVKLNINNLNKILTSHQPQSLQLRAGTIETICVKIDSENLLDGIIELTLSGINVDVSPPVKKSPKMGVDATEPLDLAASTLLLADDFLLTYQKEGEILQNFSQNFVTEKMSSEEILSDQSSASPTDVIETAELGVIASWISKLFERLKVECHDITINFELYEEILCLKCQKASLSDLKMTDSSLQSERLRGIKESMSVPLDMRTEKVLTISGLSVQHKNTALASCAHTSIQEFYICSAPDEDILIVGNLSSIDIFLEDFSSMPFRARLFQNFYTLYMRPLVPLPSQLLESSDFLPGLMRMSKLHFYDDNLSSIKDIKTEFISGFAESIIDVDSSTTSTRMVHSDDIFYSVIENPPSTSKSYGSKNVHPRSTFNQPQQALFEPNSDIVNDSLWQYSLNSLIVHIESYTLKLDDLLFSTTGHWQCRLVSLDDSIVSGAIKGIHGKLMDFSVDSVSLEYLESKNNKDMHKKETFAMAGKNPRQKKPSQGKDETEKCKKERNIDPVKIHSDHDTDSSRILKDNISDKDSDSIESLASVLERIRYYLDGFTIQMKAVNLKFQNINLIMNELLIVNGARLSFSTLCLTSPEGSLLSIESGTLKWLSRKSSKKVPSYQGTSSQTKTIQQPVSKLKDLRSPFSSMSKVVCGQSLGPIAADTPILQNLLKSYAHLNDTIEFEIHKVQVHVLQLFATLLSLAAQTAEDLLRNNAATDKELPFSIFKFLDVGIHGHINTSDLLLKVGNMTSVLILLQDQQFYISKCHPSIYLVRLFDISQGDTLIATRRILPPRPDQTSLEVMLKVVYQPQNELDRRHIDHLNSNTFSSTSSSAASESRIMSLELFHATFYIKAMHQMLISIRQHQASIFAPFLFYFYKGLDMADANSLLKTSFGQMMDTIRSAFYPKTLDQEPLFPSCQIRLLDCLFTGHQDTICQSDRNSFFRNTDHNKNVREDLLDNFIGIMDLYLHEGILRLPIFDPKNLSNEAAMNDNGSERGLNLYSLNCVYESLVPFTLFIFVDEVTLVLEQRRVACLSAASCSFKVMPDCIKNRVDSASSENPLELGNLKPSSSFQNSTFDTENLSLHHSYDLSIQVGAFQASLTKALYTLLQALLDILLTPNREDLQLLTSISSKNMPTQAIDLAALSHSLESSIQPPDSSSYTTSKDLNAQALNWHEEYLGALPVGGIVQTPKNNYKNNGFMMHQQESVDLDMADPIGSISVPTEELSALKEDVAIGPPDATTTRTNSIPIKDNIDPSFTAPLLHNHYLEDRYFKDHNSDQMPLPTLDKTLLRSQSRAKWHIYTSIQDFRLALYQNSSREEDYVAVHADHVGVQYTLHPRKKQNLNENDAIEPKDASSLHAIGAEIEQDRKHFHIASILSLTCRSLYLQDHVGSSSFQYLATLGMPGSHSLMKGLSKPILHSEASFGSSALSSFSMNLLAVYPDESAQSKIYLEYRLTIGIGAPLHCHMDQSTLDFLSSFFDTNSLVASSKAAVQNPLYFQYVHVDPIALIVDYQPSRRFNLAPTALLSASWFDIMNFLPPLSRIQLTLPKGRLSGINGGFSVLWQTIWTTLYLDAILSQKASIFLAPIQPALTMSDALLRDILRRHRSSLTGTPPSILSVFRQLVKSAATETLSLSAQGLISTHALLEKIDAYLASPTSTATSGAAANLSPNSAKGTATRRQSEYVTAPSNLHQGFSEAKEVLMKPSTAKSSLLTPAIKLTAASSKAILGLHATLDHSTPTENYEKYK